jgi:hypothetical protein
LLEERLGLRAYNLALYSGPAPASYYLLRRVLDRGARPAAVVVSFNKEILLEGPQSSFRPYPWAELLTPSEVLELCRARRDAGLFASIMAKKILPSYRDRPEIRARLLEALRGESLSPRPATPSFQRNWWTNRGAQVNAANPQVRDVAVPANARGLMAGWRPDPVNALYVARFLRLAADHGVRVFWLVPPTIPGGQLTADLGEGEAHYDLYVAELRRRFPGLTLVDARRAGFPYSVFYDPIHLDRRGAAALTERLADALAGPLAGAPGPGRVALAPFSEGPADLSLEDVGQSHLALEAIDAGVRRR